MVLHAEDCTTYIYYSLTETNMQGPLRLKKLHATLVLESKTESTGVLEREEAVIYDSKKL